jgi:hypothetical protein
MPISAPPQFRLGPSIWASTSYTTHHQLLHCYTERARELLICYQKYPPDDLRLQLIVEAAMEARALFFSAALWEPSTEELDGYFDEFVVRSVSGIADCEVDTLHAN